VAGADADGLTSEAGSRSQAGHWVRSSVLEDAAVGVAVLHIDDLTVNVGGGLGLEPRRPLARGLRDFRRPAVQRGRLQTDRRGFSGPNLSVRALVAAANGCLAVGSRRIEGPLSVLWVIEAYLLGRQVRPVSPARKELSGRLSAAPGSQGCTSIKSATATESASVTKVMARPFAPARPDRPMRCT
jgi:hypothetical protein